MAASMVIFTRTPKAALSSHGITPRNGPEEHAGVGEAADHLEGMMGDGEMPEQGAIPGNSGATDNEL